jgi:hypothetical protein
MQEELMDKKADEKERMLVFQVRRVRDKAIEIRGPAQ